MSLPNKTSVAIEAKNLVRDQSITYAVALCTIARKHQFANWPAMRDALKSQGLWT